MAAEDGAGGAVERGGRGLKPTAMMGPRTLFSWVNDGPSVCCQMGYLKASCLKPLPQRHTHKIKAPARHRQAGQNWVRSLPVMQPFLTV